MVTDESEKATVRFIPWSPVGKWFVSVPKKGAHWAYKVNLFTHWTDAIAFADREMRK